MSAIVNRLCAGGALAALLSLGAWSGAALAQESSTAAEDAGSAEADAGAEVPAPTAEDVVATVGEKSIRLGDVITLRRGLPQQYQQLPDEILGRGLVEQLIDQTLLAEAALAAGADERASVKFQIENQMRAVLAEAYMRSKVEERVNEEAIRAIYDEQYANVEGEEEVRASHILVESEDLAKEIRAELDGGGDFAALAAEHGTDGTAQRGGDLGYFVKSDMVAEFAEAAFALEAGQVGGPVQSQFGWHLIQLVDRRPRPAPAFEEVAGQIGQGLVQEAQREIVAELREGAEISITDEGLPQGAIRDDALLDAPSGAESE